MTTSAKVSWGPTTVFNTNKGTATNPSISLFGANPSPAPSTPGFSGFSSNPVTSPAMSLFSPTVSTPATANVNVAPPGTNSHNTFAHILGAPQQAALEAHMNATMHQEASRLGTRLTQLHSAYSPFQTQTAPTQQNSTCRFQHIFYDPITQAQKLEKMSLPSYPPKPSHVSDEIWHRALTQNPDPEEYIPVLVTSAEGLHSRLVAQQSKMKLHETYLTKLDETLDSREKINTSISMQMKSYRSRNVQLRQKLLCIMQKFEICRGKNVPFQESERDVFRKLVQLYQNVTQVDKMYQEVQNDAVEYSRQWNLMQQELQTSGGVILEEGMKQEAMTLLNESKTGIDEMVRVVQMGDRDLDIVRKGIQPAHVR